MGNILDHPLKLTIHKYIGKKITKIVWSTFTMTCTVYCSSQAGFSIYAKTGKNYWWSSMLTTNCCKFSQILYSKPGWSTWRWWHSENPRRTSSLHLNSFTLSNHYFTQAEVGVDAQVNLRTAFSAVICTLKLMPASLRLALVNLQCN